jgi:serine O-acetyltransferase
MIPRRLDQAVPDPIWRIIREEAARDSECEPILASFFHATILNHESLEQALSFRLAEKLGSANLPSMLIREVIDEALRKDPDLGDAARVDIRAVQSRDPACQGLLEPVLYRKGFHALEAFRVSHWLWSRGRYALALHLQNRISQVFGADIHPAARIGSGIFIDHATSVVIGETAIVEDDVSMLHEVTLGGTGKEAGDRHPKIRRGVLIGAGAKILGNVEVGEGAKIGAGSVVLSNVPAHCTAVGIPAKIIGRINTGQPALEMDHRLPLDYSI